MSNNNDDILDILIIGAGISGIGAAYHIQHDLPGKTFLIIEKKAHYGGTWWLHKYPGVRSDSDLHTFGYSFKPWTGVPIAAGEEILRYLGDVIEENHLQSLIRYQQEVFGCHYSSEHRLWTIEAQDLTTSTQIQYKSKLLFMCPGYYDHEKPFTPVWPGMEKFQGKLVHPQHWPDDVDLTDKEVIVIGSGATAATLIPNIASQVKHVTMLQRSPTWFIFGQNFSDLANELRKLKVDEAWIHEIMRKKIIYESSNFIQMSFHQPEAVKQLLLSGVKAHLGEEFDVAKHFTPSYRPWQQRIALIPNGDLFVAIRSGKASVVTDQIDHFTEKGVVIQSTQEELPADVIVTATGFYLNFMGDIPVTVDGKLVKWSEKITYRGMMFTEIPNLVLIFGYFRYSWTLRVDLVCEFVCRLLAYMDQHHYQEVIPRLRQPGKDDGLELGPWIDVENFNANYLLRGGAIHQYPQRGRGNDEWQHTQDYPKDAEQFPLIQFDDPVFQFR